MFTVFKDVKELDAIVKLASAVLDGVGACLVFTIFFLKLFLDSDEIENFFVDVWLLLL